MRWSILTIALFGCALPERLGDLEHATIIYTDISPFLGGRHKSLVVRDARSGRELSITVDGIHVLITTPEGTECKL